MKKLCFLLFLLSCFTAHAQTDNSAIVSDMYQRASKFYEDNKFAEAVTLLEKLETLSSSPDAKISYLKIKALNSLYQKDISYASTLEKSIQLFMKTAQAQNYSSAKVQEISELQQQFVASQNRILSDIEQAKASGDVNQLKTLAQQQPNSVSQSDIIAARKEENKRKYEQENSLLNSDFAEANRLKKKSGVGMRLFGLLFLGYGASQIISVKETIDDSHKQVSGFAIASAIVAPSIGIALLVSPTGRRRGKKLLKATEEKQRLLKQKYLSVAPRINLHSGAGQYGLAMRLRF